MRTTNVILDPQVPDWSSIRLPDTSPDNLNLKNPITLFKFLVSVFWSRRKMVELPENMFGKDNIPKYVLQEFHNMPNGNYSNNLSIGYIKGFDFGMLGEMEKARKKVSSELNGMNSVLDIGCGGGKMCEALRDSGIKEVWGLDPSPYLLKYASSYLPEVKFVQGVIENTSFPNDRFDAITACFVFHEIPPKYADEAIAECNRILKKGGYLYISEPSSIQMSKGYFYIIKNYGLKGFYFKFMLNFIHEPFVALWHKREILSWLDTNGFNLEKDEDSLPVRYIKAIKIKDL